MFRRIFSLLRAFEQVSLSGMEKYHSKIGFAPFRDAPFAVRGPLGGSNSNVEQARGYTSSPLGALRSKVSPPGSRPLHTSRPLSAPVANRPLSPHLPLKKPQLSATFSISHRIFGVALGAAIISIPLATKFSLMFGV
uniref:Succinate dehydrogenase subunit 3-1, mitochondrial n=1 Tax=Arundo donax TaxID=35708 RepID=A0A0A9CBE0_ARUDO